MSISISEQAFEDLFEETVEYSQHPDTVDPLDVVCKYPELLGKGYTRDIKLRKGLHINILDVQIRDRFIPFCIIVEGHFLHFFYLKCKKKTPATVK
jgi:hypothetical protein